MEMNGNERKISFDETFEGRHLQLLFRRLLLLFLYNAFALSYASWIGRTHGSKDGKINS